MSRRMTKPRVPVGTTVETNWGPAVVTADLWPDDPNHEITYTAESRCPRLAGAFEHVTPVAFICQPCRGRQHTRCCGCDCQHRERP